MPGHAAIRMLSQGMAGANRSPTAMANELGLRSICFEVDDLQAAVDGLAANGYGLVGGIAQHEYTWRMAMCAGRRESSSH
jgi:hypothetical protein